MTELAIAVATAVVFAAIGVVVYFAYRDSPKWGTLASGQRYFAPPGFEAKRLELALALAERCLTDCTVFPRAAIAAVVARASVLVTAEESWVDAWGRRIGGFTQVSTSTVVVGPDLSALCHELAHLLEAYCFGATDDGHVQWMERGITAADEAYRRAL